MSPHSLLPSLRQRLTLFNVTLLSLLVILCGVGLVSGTAHSPQDDPAASTGEEREFKSTVPEHVPIKVKVKNEQSFKRKENKNWAREMEIEVKNTGSKPIYYLYVIIVMPDVLDGSHAMSFRVAYGRKELAYIETPIEPEDVPIKPGESAILKVRENKVRGFELWRDREKRDDPKKIEFDMQIINFGDGTGLRGKVGRPYLPKKRSQNETRMRGGGSACRPALKARDAEPSRGFSKLLSVLKA